MFDDLQSLLFTRPPMTAGRYFFLSFRQPEQGRAWLARVVDRVATAQALMDSPSVPVQVSLGFTCHGLRALGIDDASIATWPEDFRVGMPARAEILGDRGPNHPDNWEGGLASADLHAALVLFARDRAERERWVSEQQALLADVPGVSVLSAQDTEIVSSTKLVEHFGYRDRLTQVTIEGTGVQPTPGSDPPCKAGEFVLGYPDEKGRIPSLPKPEILSRNGSFVAYRKLQQHVAAFREFLRQQAETPEEQELLAAKMMGRWRSGAPLVLAPDKDDPELAEDPQRNNNFNYGKMDPLGYACPIGAHLRRVNPRDTVVDSNRRLLLRRGMLFGPHLPEGEPEDGVERGGTLLLGCASLSRQFEFVQQAWIDDPTFQGLKNEVDPLAGDQDGTLDFTIPKRPLRRKITGLPRFITVKGGAYLFLPGIQGLRLCLLNNSG